MITRMIFDAFGVCMKLVITTIVILNSIGVISPQYELEQGLATDCGYYGMNKDIVIFSKKKNSKFVDKVCCYLDVLCGDKCLIYPKKKCECGNNTFEYGDQLYCCIPNNENCKIEGMCIKLSHD